VEGNVVNFCLFMPYPSLRPPAILFDSVDLLVLYGYLIWRLSCVEMDDSRPRSLSHLFNSFASLRSTTSSTRAHEFDVDFGLGFGIDWETQFCLLLSLSHVKSCIHAVCTIV